jgi:hypothetical protein
MGRAGAGQHEAGKAAARQRRTRGMAYSGAEAAGALHMAGKSGAARRVEEQRRPGLEEEDED